MNRFFCLLILAVVFTANLQAQSPQSFQYQAVVRNSIGAVLVNQSVNFRISILSGSVIGTPEYIETHSGVTNDYGVVILPVGNGTILQGNLSTINWGLNSYYIKVEADPAGGTNYLDMGTTQLLSVPYALYSEKSGNADTLWNLNGSNIYNSNIGNVGVGINNPTGRMVVQGSNSALPTDPLFEVKNAAGQTIFVVYPDSVHIYVKDSGGSKSNQGGFAVSGRNNAKAVTNNYLTVTPDSTRIFTGDTISGFGVQNLGSGTSTSYMHLTPFNYFIGHQAGNSITTGRYNSFIGYESGFRNNTGTKNYFIGYRSGYNNLSGVNNIFIGDSAGFGNTVGIRNVYIGNESGYTSDSGSFNVFVGYQTGMNNRNGSGNVFQGYQSGYSNTFGGGNTANGYQALYSNTVGIHNVAIGNQALWNNTSGNFNVATGFINLYSNTTGSENVANGYFCLSSNTTGSLNSAIGSYALALNTTGGSNSAIGAYTLANNTTGYENTATGAHSLLYNTTGYHNTANGVNALWANTTGIDNTSTGYNSLVFNTIGSDNTANGMTALFSNTEGGWNTAMGLASLYNNTTGTSNTSVGSLSLFRNTTGINNTAIGVWSYFTPALAAYNNSTGIGYGSAITASNQIRLGDNTAGMSIGGFAAWTNLSDGRFKKDIKENVPGLEFITKLKPVTYHFDKEKMDDFLNKPDSLRSKSDLYENTLFTGFVAQDVEKAAQEIGFDFNGVDKPKNENDYYGLRYAEFTVPLVKAVQELNEKNEKLELENKVQKELILQLIKRIEEIENKIK